MRGCGVYVDLWVAVTPRVDAFRALEHGDAPASGQHAPPSSCSSSSCFHCFATGVVLCRLSCPPQLDVQHASRRWPILVWGRLRLHQSSMAGPGSASPQQHGWGMFRRSLAPALHMVGLHCFVLVRWRAVSCRRCLACLSLPGRGARHRQAPRGWVPQRFLGVPLSCCLRMSPPRRLHTWCLAGCCSSSDSHLTDSQRLFDA